MSQYSQMTLDDVLDQFVAEFPELTREGLLSFIGRYPEHREALVSFAATAAEQRSLPPEEMFSPEQAARFAGRAASVLENHVFQRDHARAAPAAPAAAFSLGELAAAAGSSLAQVAERLSLDMGLAAKLDRRIIRAETIPRRLVDSLAEFLGSTADAVIAVLSGPPRMSAVPSFMIIRSASTPVQETFSEAVALSTLPEADKDRWMSAT